MLKINYFFIHKDKFIILQFTPLNIIQNILRTITSLTYLNKFECFFYD